MYTEPYAHGATDCRRITQLDYLEVAATVFVFGGGARSFQRSAARVTVGALGPNAQHFLHATNFGSRSPFIQTSELPQKGQGCNSSTETGNPGLGLIAALSPGLRTWFSCSRRYQGMRALDHLEPIRAVHCVQFGIYLVEETLDFVALIRTRMFFQAAEQVLLLR